MDVPAPPPADAGEPALDVMPYVLALWRRKWVILAVTVLSGVVGVFYALRQPKVYASSTSLVIDVAAPRFLDNEVKEVMGDERSNYWFNREYYETQAAVITSRSVATRVVDKLGLQGDAAFLGLEGIADEARRKQAMAGADAVSRVRSRIRVLPEKNSRVLHISVEDGDPKRAALLANEVASAYIAENMALKLKTTEYASTWLEERLAELEQRSRQSELEVFRRKRDADIITLSRTKEGKESKSQAAEELETYRASLVQVNLRLAALGARVEAMRKLRQTQPQDARWAEGLPQAQVPAVSELRGALLQQRTTCLELEQRYLAEHPKMKECRSKQELLEQELRRSLDNLVRAAETELAQAQAERRQLEQMVGEAKQRASQATEKEIEYQQLQREADNNQRLYELVLRRHKEIELSSLLRTTNVRVLDAARPEPVPVRPNTRGLILLFVLVGLLGGVALVLGVELLDASVVTRADVEERVGLALLGTVPLLESKGAGSSDLYVHHQPRSQAAEAFRTLRTNLLFMSPDEPFRTLVVSSARPSEGKSTLVINLGIAMAQAGHRVVLLDTDMRRPRLHLAFGLRSERGVSSLVVGQGTLEEAVQATEVPDLFVLPCGPLPPNPAELLHARGFAELLARLRERYDRILLDSPPVGAVSDALVLARQVDGALLVFKAGSTHREAARGARRALLGVQARLLGGVLNRVDLQSSRYTSEYDSYHSYRGYYGGRDEHPA